MKIIEFFGVPCSGKTFLYEYFLKKSKIKNLRIYSYKSVIYKFASRDLKLNPIERITIEYFKLIKLNKNNFRKNKTYKNNTPTKISPKFKFKNIISNQLYQNYKKICNKIYLKFEKENKKFVLDFVNTIKKSKINHNRKADLINWFKELCASKYLINKNKNKIDYLIDDEGFVQRIFSFIDIKNKKQIAKQYLSNNIQPNYLIYLITDKKILIKRSKKRYSGKQFKYKNNKQIDNYLKYEKFIINNIYNSRILKIRSKYDKNKLIKNIYEYIKK